MTDENVPLNELRIRHLTTDEAMIKLDSYLHEAFMDGQTEVRIIHGKGAGILRELVRRELAHHPLVKSYRAGGRGEGGAGVTVARLSDD